jgi:hypothetical protein
VRVVGVVPRKPQIHRPLIPPRGCFRRPFSDDELRSNAPQVITCNDFQREVAVTQIIAGKQFDKVFTFDKVCCFLPHSGPGDLRV